MESPTQGAAGAAVTGTKEADKSAGEKVENKTEEKVEAVTEASSPTTGSPAKEKAKKPRSNTRSSAPRKNNKKQAAEPPQPKIDLNQPPKAEITIKSLLQAGAHFGHQTSRWNPAMKNYIYTSRNGIHIINLPKTVECWAKSKSAIVDMVSRGGSVMFVGTKKQASDVIGEEAVRSGSSYVCHRWLGGMLTNFQTIRKNVERLKEYQTIIEEQEALKALGKTPKFTKKERLIMSREIAKLERSLGGIKHMYSLPNLIFVVDIRRESIAIKEATKLNIPVVALVDTNCNPELVNHMIPCNDDGTRSIRLFTEAVADAVIEGKRLLKKRGQESKASGAKDGGVEESLVVNRRTAATAEDSATEAADVTPAKNTEASA